MDGFDVSIKPSIAPITNTEKNRIKDIFAKTMADVSHGSRKPDMSYIKNGKEA
jgi:hypothetical protein